MELLNKFYFEGFDTPRIILTAALILTYLIFSTRAIKDLNSYKKYTLLLLRYLFALIIIFILGELSIIIPSEEGRKSTVAVLIDTSKSMGMKAWDGKSSRLEATKSVVLDEGGFLKKLKEDHNIVYFSFDTELKGVPSVELLEPTGNGTDIAGGIKGAVEKIEGLSAILLFSDGMDTEGLNEATSQEISLLQVPVYSFSPGSSAEKDAGIFNLRSSGFALNREAYKLSFEIAMNGWKELDIPITLKDERSVLKTEQLRLKDGEKRWVDLEFTPLTPGRTLFTLEIPVFAGDEYPQNNRIDFIVNVLRDKYRVLLLSGKPHWDLRFLREVLKSSPWIDLVNFNILRTPFDLVNIPEYELSLIPFPADEIFREGLDSFDIFIMQNFDPTQFVPPFYMKNVSSFVKRGGGLAIVGGSLLSKANFYLSSEMADVVPINGGRADMTGRFRVKPRDGFKNHPLNRTFSRMKIPPEVDFLNGITEAKPWASIIAETEEDNPVVIAGAQGKGRVMAVLTNALWRIGFSSTERLSDHNAISEFWSDAIRWLAGEPDTANILVEPTKDNYYSGDEVKLNVMARSKSYNPIKGGRIQLKVFDKNTGKVIYNEERILKGGDELFKFDAQEPGTYKAILKVIDSAGNIESRENTFIVSLKKSEMDSPFTRDDLLRQVAEATGGEFYELKNLPEKLKVKKRKEGGRIVERRIPIWNSIYIVTAAFLLLNIEWYLRRRWGLR